MNPNEFPQQNVPQPPMPIQEAPMQAPEAPVQSQQLPEWNKPAGPEDAMKKKLLQKMMENLLNKSGRSMNELVNGVKAVIGAYKNYSKEIDALSGNVSSSPSSTDSSASSPVASGGIQSILRDIQSKKATKDGGGGPGMPSSMPQAPSMVAPQTITPPRSGIPPIHQMAPLPPANVPTSAGETRNLPPPVNRLGIWGF